MPKGLLRTAQRYWQKNCSVYIALHNFSFISPQQASSIIALAKSDRTTGVCSVVMLAQYSLHAFKLTLLARCTARAANREYFPQRVLRRWKAIRCDITIWTSYCSL